VRTSIKSPVGTLHLAATDHALLAVVWRRHSTPQLSLDSATERPDHPLLVETVRQLDEYFSGQRRVFDLPLEFRGTDFQKRVWRALTKIPAGSTASYADIARRIDAPKSFRAVAQACGANPIALAIPCHRVVRNDGALSGYRWGVARKRALLEREAVR